MIQRSVTPIAHESLGEQVYRTVRDLIVSQVFPPGSKLNVEQLGRDLGVSRTPVWDAMRRLESEALVEVVPRHGVFVTNYGVAKIRDLFAVRAALEGLAARQAAARPAAEAREALQAAVRELRRAARRKDLDHYSRAAIRFHDVVLAAAGNQVLTRLLENVYAQILVLRLHSLHLAERLEASVAEHSGIAAAIVAGDGEGAERRARAHAGRVLQDVLEQTDAGGLPAPPAAPRVARP
jgi:DNA-binding GntR family transcriptional regulator